MSFLHFLELVKAYRVNPTLFVWSRSPFQKAHCTPVWLLPQALRGRPSIHAIRAAFACPPAHPARSYWRLPVVVGDDDAPVFRISGAFGGGRTRRVAQ